MSQLQTSPDQAGAPATPPAYDQGYAPPAAAAPADALALPAGVSVVSPLGRLGAYLLDAVLITVTLGIGWLIWAATIGNGQTPGKKILGHRVIVTDTVTPAAFGRMFFVRGILAGLVAGIAMTFTLGIVLLMPFWDRRNQNLWDKISSCVVVNDPGDAWNTAAA